MVHINMPAPTKDHYHLTWGIQLRNIDPVQARIIRQCIMNQFMDTEDYKQKTPAQPFLQGYSENPEGEWVYVEFHTQLTQATLDYITYLETQVNDETRYKETAEYMVLD